MTERGRFVTLEYLANNLVEVARQTGEETMILTNGMSRLIAAILVNNTYQELKENVDSLRDCGGSPHGFGRMPLFIKQSDLRHPWSSCTEKLRRNDAVIIEIEDPDRPYELLALLPLVPGIEGLVLGGLQEPGSSPGNDYTPLVSSEEVARNLGINLSTRPV